MQHSFNVIPTERTQQSMKLFTKRLSFVKKEYIC